jgi:hypothetical protein
MKASKLPRVPPKNKVTLICCGRITRKTEVTEVLAVLGNEALHQLHAYQNRFRMMNIVKGGMDGTFAIHGESKLFIRRPPKRTTWQI